MARLALVALTLALAGCVDALAALEDCSVEEPRQASLDAAGATRLAIDAGAGRLEVRGVPGAATVEVRGTACAPDPERLATVELRTERRGDTLYVETVFAEDVPGERRLSLSIDAPASLAVTVEDGSGETIVRGVAAVSIDDGSGAVEVREIAGDVEVSDGSGSVTLTGVGGGVTVDDGSGDLEIADVGGDVVVDDDGSGGIEIAGVGGSVTIGEDGSGGISARDVRGDFTLRRDGSGGVEVDADGRVSLPED
ncbi:MAG TPA: hypothetical protein VHM02_10415 [Thermoanaerobaculia bacterium]|nr:hypothetical protein [Thermoanaerobaculia bacterium]